MNVPDSLDARTCDFVLKRPNERLDEKLSICRLIG
jgi:hypothetical protein